MRESPTSPARVVVMTGATSGLGAHALRHLLGKPDTRAIIGARGAGPQGVESLPLDLVSLASVRHFAEMVKQRLASDRIEMLVLNAAGQYRNAERSADGFEATFAVNHLAHYLLARLLLPSMAVHSRLVFTTSDTHDPAIMPLPLRMMTPKALELDQLAHPTKPRFGAVYRAYSASKLCNILTVRAFEELDEVKALGIRAIAYNPGLTLGTKLGRPDSDRQRAAHPPSAVVRMLLGLVSKLDHIFYPGTPERAGEALAQLALGTITPPPGRFYASLVRGAITFPDPSELARSDEARDELWRESAEMVGIPPGAASGS